MQLRALPIAMLACGLAALLLRHRPDPPEQGVAAPSALAEGGSAAQPLRGLAIQVDSAYRPVERYGRLVREIAALGANAVLFSLNGYQDNAASAEIHVDAQHMPTDEQWQALFAIARRHRLKIILMPKILLSQPRGREWRGVIDPGQNWQVWFEHYRRFILHYANLAAQCGADVFVVGSELVSAEKFTERWRRLIAEVRTAFPHGLLTYSANWDHYASIQFWDDLDLVGMTSYHRTAEQPRPPLSALLQSWQRHQEEILQWQQRIGKPLLFTEAGWCSQDGCSLEPWNYLRHPRSSPSGLEEQRRNYQAFLQTWAACPAVAGILWWEWVPGAGGLQDAGYTPKNKPAQAVLEAWLRGAGKFPP